MVCLTVFVHKLNDYQLTLQRQFKAVQVGKEKKIGSIWNLKISEIYDPSFGWEDRALFNLFP